MRFLREVYSGIIAYLKAIRFIWKHKFYWFILIPAVLMAGIYKTGEYFRHRTVATEAKNMNEIIWYLLYLLLEISVSILLMKFAKYLVVIILSPLLAFLSEKTERIISGTTYRFNREQFIHDIKRAIRIAVRNMMWEYFFFLLIYFVAFLGWKKPENAPVYYITFVIGFYYYGFSFMDYMNERRKLNVDESILFIRKHRGLAMAIGAIYSIMIMVPVDLSVIFSLKGFDFSRPFHSILVISGHFILWILASAAPVLTIVSSTIAMENIPKPAEIESNFSK